MTDFDNFCNQEGVLNYLTFPKEVADCINEQLFLMEYLGGATRSDLEKFFRRDYKK